MLISLYNIVCSNSVNFKPYRTITLAYTRINGICGGDFFMTEEQKIKIRILREQNLTFTKIAEQTGISRNTIKSFMYRETTKNEALQNKDVCLHCGKILSQLPKTKPRKFCCESCRTAYWNTHRHLSKHNNTAFIVCAYCGKSFHSNGRKNRKYCCRRCYINARFGEASHDKKPT